MIDVNKTFWVVGKIDSLDDFHSWEFCGLYDSEESAVQMCKTDLHFVGPVELNQNLESGVDWPLCYYPLFEG